MISLLMLFIVIHVMRAVYLCYLSCYRSLLQFVSINCDLSSMMNFVNYLVL